MIIFSGRTLAGAARAAKRLDAVIIDSGIGCGIEKFAMREGLNLVGVSPEAEVQFPKLNATSHPQNQLTNGHTHFFLLNGAHKQPLKWGDEATLKLRLAARIARGRIPGRRPCKVVGLFLGDNSNCEAELALFGRFNWPLLVVPGSAAASQAFRDICGHEPTEDSEEQDPNPPGDIPPGVISALRGIKRIQVCHNNSEEVASSLHLLLTLSF